VSTARRHGVDAIAAPISAARQRRQCMRDKVRRAILAGIQNGEYPPGTRLKELVLAEQFGVSQAPVREALRELEALGVLESERYRGTRVREISAVETSQAYALRALIEEAAAQQATPLAAADLASLCGLLDALRDAARRRDFDAYAQHNASFHRHIVRCADNAVLLRVWDSLAVEPRTRITAQRIAPRLEAAAQSHQVIVDALASGDGARAGRVLRDHIESILWMNAAE